MGGTVQVRSQPGQGSGFEVCLQAACAPVLPGGRAGPATAGIRCVALSANAMPDDIRRALENGFDDYWTKPLDLRAFMRALDRRLGMAPG